MSDWSAGLADAEEAVVADAPEVPFWSENLLFAGYDPAADVGLWLHLGTVPNDWTMWEDRVFMTLPGGKEVLAMWAFHRTVPDRRPAGSNLAFECVEPFHRWRIRFDGYAQVHDVAAMAAGPAPGGERRRVRIDLDVECVTPVWDAQTAAGGIAGQGWAKHHYEQLFRARGRFDVDDATVELDAAGWRDHSRGPRGGPGGAPWGGHVIASCLFPSGRGFIASRYWRPDGGITLEGGCVFTSDARHAAVVRDVPRLTSLQSGAEHLPVGLEWAGGSADFVLETRRAVWIAMPKRVAIGRDLSGSGLMYVLDFGSCTWEGETGTVYLERSDALNALPPRLFPAV